MSRGIANLMDNIPLKCRLELKLDQKKLRATPNSINISTLGRNPSQPNPQMTSYNSTFERVDPKNTPFYSNRDRIVLNHVKIADQHVYNLCGYHIAHTLVFFAKLFKLSCINLSMEEERAQLDYLIMRTKDKLNCSVSFWQFHYNMTKYLRQFSIKFNKKTDKYPWREEDCLFGDYERVYHYVFMGYHPLYQEIYFGKQFQTKKNKTFLSSLNKLKLHFGGNIGNWLESFDSEDPS